MPTYLQTIILAAGFAIVAIAANQIARYLVRYKLPVITGLLITGILSGPYVLDLIPLEAEGHLKFVNNIALAFIAYAASAELYLREMRSTLHSIKWMSIGQLVLTFLVSSVAVYFLAGYIPFMAEMGVSTKISVAVLIGAIFVARSPASAIAIVTEMRAKGPFVQTALGVTVLTDFMVIVLFTFCLEIAVAVHEGMPFNLTFVGLLLSEFVLSFLIGLALGKLLIWLLASEIAHSVKMAAVLISGYLIYLLHDFLYAVSLEYLGHSINVEPLMVCIIASFYVTNYSEYRAEFLRIIEGVGPYVYVTFFVLAGASVSLPILGQIVGITAMLFVVRLVSLMIGAQVGGRLAGDPPEFNRIAWMPYVTQAGVGLGLATVVAGTFPEWGQEFATIVISVIIVNQIVGPPFFKWAINIVGEGHTRADIHEFDGVRDAIIFGLETQSVALAKQLQENGWIVKIATRSTDFDESEYPDVDIHKINDHTLETLTQLEAQNAEAIVTMLTDDENYSLAETIYEHVGTKDVIVRLNNRFNFNKFHELGALIVDPSTAIVSLLDHFVRSPQAASLLLGMEANQDSMDITVLNPDMHGLRLRNLRLPSDILVLSLKRRGNQIITHGYTRLRRGDVLTLVGSRESLQQVALKFEPI